MSQTTPDIRQHCPDCGGRIGWEGFPDEQGTLYMGRCGLRCGWEILDVDQPERPLTATEKLLTGRIAELEAAQRWRVTAEELPPVGEWVLVRRQGPGFEESPFELAKFDGTGWESEWASVGCLPDLWMPIPAAPVALSQGADVPKAKP